MSLFLSAIRVFNSFNTYSPPNIIETKRIRKPNPLYSIRDHMIPDCKLVLNMCDNRYPVVGWINISSGVGMITKRATPRRANEKANLSFTIRRW